MIGTTRRGASLAFRGDGTGLLENRLGAAQMGWALATPLLRGRRTRWGATAEEMRRHFPGDALVPRPRWQFLHAITVEAPAVAVWPWIAQVGHGRGASTRSSSWRTSRGATSRTPPPSTRSGRGWRSATPSGSTPRPRLSGSHSSRPATPSCYTATAWLPAPGGPGRLPGVSVSWAFVVERLDGARSRLFSRYRADHGPGVGNALSYGPWLVEPVRFVMDRRMLWGIKRRAERKQGVEGGGEA